MYDINTLDPDKIISNRYDFVYFFDVSYGNPNGDPDADGAPRMDDEVGKGLCTDVSLKRKVRDYVATTMEGIDGYDIYIKRGVPLNTSDERALDEFGITLPDLVNLKKEDAAADVRITDFMCRTFYDIRTFGAVMTTYSKASLPCAGVRGPVQVGLASSVDVVNPIDFTITRQAITTVEDATRKNNEMGHRTILPYGLYRVHGHIDPTEAERTTGFSERDLGIFFNALERMFDFGHSSMRGDMAPRALIVFKHGSKFGNVGSHRLLECVHCEKKPGVVAPRSYDDYNPVTVDEDAVRKLSSNVEVLRLI